ncbi:MAG: cyanase [Azospirillum brasilense]|nr:MAG: cyanase [Azospirillum brasilense]
MTARADLTEKIVRIKIERDLTWAGLAALAGGLSKEYVTAALMGQMPLPRPAAEAIGAELGLDDYETKLLQQPPYRGSLPTQVPTDPLIYRFYELVSVYGTTFKALIHEEFGDGIMSAIDFRMDLQREPNNAGDRVSITMSGKFLPYKQY